MQGTAYDSRRALQIPHADFNPQSAWRLDPSDFSGSTIEAWFRTCKYAPSYPPNGFATIEDTHRWVLGFVSWYNHQHRHSGLAFVTPEQRHNGSYRVVLGQRREVYRRAHEQHPLRWKRHVRPWEVPGHVWLNLPSPSESRMAA